MELVIMAAGMGSRFGGLKQLEPIDDNGNFIIDYSIYDAIRTGFDKVTFIIKEENFELFRNTVGKRTEKQITTNYIFQNNCNIPNEFKIPEDRKKPLGTGHAILCTKGTIHSSFAVINADDFYGYDAFKTVANFLKTNENKNTYALVGYKAINTIGESGSVKRGICKCENGKLKSITESEIKKVNGKLFAKAIDGTESSEHEIDNNEIVSMNMFGFTTKFLDYLDSYFISFLNKNKDNLSSCEFYLPTVVSSLINEGLASVDTLTTTAKWYGITYKEDKDFVVQSIKNLIKNGEYPENLWG